MLHLCSSLAKRASPPAQPRLGTLIIDLDETVLRRSRGSLDRLLLYAWPGALVGTPYDSSLSSLSRLSSRFHVAAVTARWRLAERGTHAWLRAHDLGHVPVVYAGEWHPGDASRAGFKAAAIRYYKSHGWDPRLGVGDRPSDLVAYAGEGLCALMVAHASGVPPGHCAADLRRVRAAEVAARPSAPVLYFTDDAAVHADPAGAAGLTAAPLALLASRPWGGPGSGGLLYSPVTAAGGGPPPVWQQVAEAVEGCGLGGWV
jgi:hypothetical protein